MCPPGKEVPMLPEESAGPVPKGGPAPGEGAEPGKTGEGRAPSRQALADTVYESIKAMVMDHEIAPGARVGIEALARTLQVSPTPVREALARLESDGLVVKRSLAGYRATELLDREGVVELYEMRLLLEPRAAALAALHADDTMFDQLEEIQEEMRHLPESGDRYAIFRDFVALDQRFHELLAQAARRPLLYDAIERLHSHLHIFRLSTIPGAGKPTHVEHERIVRAVLRRSPERAAEAMAAHVEASLQRQLARDGF
jgi:DNA-binding GntR family transcriptional regulator